jgi:hypothetical protein
MQQVWEARSLQAELRNTGHSQSYQACQTIVHLPKTVRGGIEGRVQNRDHVLAKLADIQNTRPDLMQTLPSKLLSHPLIVLQRHP